MQLNLVCPINSLSYGIASYNILKALHNLGHEVALHIIGRPEFVDEHVQKALNRTQNSLHAPDYPSIRIWHQNELALHAGKPRIGFPFFELDRFRPDEQMSIRTQDAIFVASGWAKEVIKNSIIDAPPVHVVPLGVDTEIFKCKPEISKDKTVFLNIGKFEKRKAHDLLADIFSKAFGPKDNVELLLLPNNPFLTAAETHGWTRCFKESPLGNKIKIINRIDNLDELVKVINRTDVAVFPSRAEGWNLCALESMACGKHVILTNYSAHTEFANKENAHLVNIDELEVAHDNKWFFGQGSWAKLGHNQVDQIVEYMRICHKQKQENGPTINKHGIETARKFTWENTVAKLIEGINSSYS